MKGLGRARPPGPFSPCLQLLGPEEVRVAPGARLRRVAKLLQGIGAEAAGLRVGRIGEDDVAHRLGDEAVLAPGEVLACARDDRRCAAHVLDDTCAPRSTGGSGLRLAGLASYQPRYR